MMFRYVIQPNNYLNRQVIAFYNYAYMKSDHEGSSSAIRVYDAIRTLKNRFNNISDFELFRTKKYIRTIVAANLKQIINK